MQTYVVVHNEDFKIVRRGYLQKEAEEFIQQVRARTRREYDGELIGWDELVKKLGIPGHLVVEFNLEPLGDFIVVEDNGKIVKKGYAHGKADRFIIENHVT